MSYFRDTKGGGAWLIGMAVLAAFILAAQCGCYIDGECAARTLEDK